MKLATRIAVTAAIPVVVAAALTAVAVWAPGARWLLLLLFAAAVVAAVFSALYLEGAVARPLSDFIRSIEQLRKSVAAGDLDARLTGEHRGQLKPVVAAINGTLEILSDKTAWYVGIIDAVPFPIHVTDADMKWTFMNKAFEALMIREKRVKDRKHGVGMACSNASANICNTEGCGIRQLKKGVRESYFDWCGMNCKQDTAPLLDRKGQTIGYVETVTDLTPLIRARNYTQREIERLAGNLTKLAQGDMNLDMALTDKDQHTGEAHANFSKLKESLGNTVDSLNQVLARVSEAATQVSSAAGQIASSSQSVASGASEQARAIQETSTHLDTMTTLTSQASESASQANAVAQSAEGAAKEGTAAMAEMVSAMGRIRESAEATSQIIKDINEITFQTNLLALNAAVEAARAGEAGRGFAVVAEEVRSLALRSKEAAQKTEELIRQSVKEAETGAATSKQVNEKLSQIADGIGKVSGIVKEIAAAAKEQASGIQQVTESMTRMNKVTQQNAANSEESSSAAEELSSQSEELVGMVSTFKLKRGTELSTGQVAAATSRPALPARGQKLLA